MEQHLQLRGRADQKLLELEEGVHRERELSKAIQKELNIVQAQASHLRLQLENGNR